MGSDRWDGAARFVSFSHCEYCFSALIRMESMSDWRKKALSLAL